MEWRNDLATEGLLDGLPGDEHERLKNVLDSAHGAYLREQADDCAEDVVRLPDYQGPRVAWARVDFRAP